MQQAGLFNEHIHWLREWDAEIV